MTWQEYLAREENDVVDSGERNMERHTEGM